MQKYETTLTIPERARLFNSIICDKCHEKTAEHLIRIQNGENLCMYRFKKLLCIC